MIVWKEGMHERVCKSIYCRKAYRTKEARHGKAIYPVLTQEFLTEVLKPGNNEQFSQTHRSFTVNHNKLQHKTMSAIIGMCLQFMSSDCKNSMPKERLST